MRARTDDGTGNLGRHISTCDGRSVEPSQSTITTFAAGSTYTKPLMRFKLTKWVTVRNRPYAIIADPKLVDIFRMLYAKVEVPHPSTLSRDVREIFTLARYEIGRILQVRNQIYAHVGY